MRVLLLLLLANSLMPAQDSETFADRFWLSGQVNFITQGHRTFKSLYEGPNSLSANTQAVTSRVATLYTGFRITDNTDVVLDIEASGGHGIGEALGVAGFTNLDVVRNPSLGQAPYVARIMLHHMFALSKETTEVEKGPFQFAGSLPVRRLDVRVGKMGTVDWFDVNSIGSDSHYQFMNWALDNNGAYDYAADTRGYTYGVVLEYTDKAWSFRYGAQLMPKEANGLHLDANISRSRADNFELELRRELLKGRLTTLRPLMFLNHANMGSYRDAIHAYQAHLDPVPDVTAYRKQSTLKYGFGLNLEQELTRDLRAYGRAGWNEGHNESYAYTEIDQTISGGIDLRGTKWHRKEDKLGAAFASNGISGDHREYLKLGGQGFILGDGNLNYGRESTFETYYNTHAWHGITISVDGQRVWNPGYNRDRGPIWVGSVRLHLEGILLRAGK